MCIVRVTCVYVCCMGVCARSSAECSWVLSSRESGKVVEVEVTDIELEAADADDDDLCPDYLAAYDGEHLAALKTERNNRSQPYAQVGSPSTSLSRLGLAVRR